MGGRPPAPDAFRTLADCDPQQLIAAINDANAARADGPHTIALSPGCTYTLTQPDNFWYGPNGLPAIASAAAASWAERAEMRSIALTDASYRKTRLAEKSLAIPY